LILPVSQLQTAIDDVTN